MAEAKQRVIRTDVVDGWPLAVVQAEGGEEPLVEDLELGRRLGFSNPIDVRKLIRRHAGELGDVSCHRGKNPAGGRPGRAYLLTEAQALFIAAKSETPKANELLRGTIAVFLAWRRGRLAGGVDRDTVELMVRQAVAHALVAHQQSDHMAGAATMRQRENYENLKTNLARRLVDAGRAKSTAEAHRRIANKVQSVTGFYGQGQRISNMSIAVYWQCVGLFNQWETEILSEQGASRRARKAAAKAMDEVLHGQRALKFDRAKLPN